jgi:hypothetical protein
MNLSQYTLGLGVNNYITNNENGIVNLIPPKGSGPCKLSRDITPVQTI